VCDWMSKAIRSGGCSISGVVIVNSGYIRAGPRGRGEGQHLGIQARCGQINPTQLCRNRPFCISGAD